MCVHTGGGQNRWTCFCSEVFFFFSLCCLSIYRSIDPNNALTLARHCSQHALTYLCFPLFRRNWLCVCWSWPPLSGYGRRSGCGRIQGTFGGRVQSHEAQPSGKIEVGLLCNWSILPPVQRASASRTRYWSIHTKYIHSMAPRVTKLRCGTFFNLEDTSPG